MTRREVMDRLGHDEQCGRRIDPNVLDPASCERCGWLNLKLNSAEVVRFLRGFEVGYTFRLTGGGRAYDGAWRKNEDGTWSQVSAPDMPLMTNVSGEGLGFCVSPSRIVECALAGGVAA